MHMDRCPRHTIGSMENRSQHWNDAYSEGDSGVSWFQEDASPSLDRLHGFANVDDALIDVGGGSSRLVDSLIELGFERVTVLDVSESALDISKDRLGGAASSVTWIVRDLLDWTPTSDYDIWHDRAVFHFLTSNADRDAYRRLLDAALAPGGYLVMAVFAEDGPTTCSGLEVRCQSQDELAAWLGDDFEIIELSREEHTTPGGSIQPFNWLVARRPF